MYDHTDPRVILEDIDAEEQAERRAIAAAIEAAASEVQAEQTQRIPTPTNGVAR